MTSHANMRLYIAHISSPQSDHNRRPHQQMSPNINSCMSDEIISYHKLSHTITSISSCQLILLLVQNPSPLLPLQLAHNLSPLKQGTNKNQPHISSIKFLKNRDFFYSRTTTTSIESFVELSPSSTSPIERVWNCLPRLHHLSKGCGIVSVVYITYRKGVLKKFVL